MTTPRKKNHVSSNSPTKYEDYIMNLSPLRPTTSSSSISTHINLLSSSSLSPSLIVHRITSVEELRFQTDSGGPGLSTDLVPRRTSRRRCLFSETVAAAVSGSKTGDDVEVAGATRSLSRAVSALAGLNWEDKSSMNPLYLNHVISLWRDLIPTGYAYAAPSSSSLLEEDQRDVPAKKRTKLEETETRSCKRCSCRKSRCLKLYCECFGSGNYCTGGCLCHNCLNKPIFKDKVLEARSRIESRNPLAFTPKLIVIQAQTPASNKHRQGCKCKRSSCLKKYCECFQAGVGCSFNCRCQGCQNPLGCKHAHPAAGSIRGGESNILNPDTIMNSTRRHVLGAALLDSEESRILGWCHNVPAKMELLKHHHNDNDVPHLSPPPHILNSSSPNGKRVSLPRATLSPILQQP